LQRRSFIEKGIELVDGPECPLCDTPWEDEQHLRDHLKAKLAKSEEARKIQQALLNNGTAIAQERSSASIGAPGSGPEARDIAGAMLRLQRSYLFGRPVWKR
jgi:hypothetical protein